MPPCDAATVMLVRSVPGAGAEVYMLRRQRSMAFAPGAYVFPRGSVDDSDAEGGHGWAGPLPDQFAPALGLPPAGAQALIRAAVRETFEECEVLLAGPPADRPPAARGHVHRRPGLADHPGRPGRQR